jgi:hypothetical protein
MANIYTTIQRKVNQDKFDFSLHSLEELASEKFNLADAVKIILAPHNSYQYTDDKSHDRYSFEGIVNDGRMLRVIVFLYQGRVQIKTAYEIFEL